MSYSIEIFRIVKDYSIDFCYAQPIDFCPDSHYVPDSYIRSIRIDDLNIDPVNFFAIAGRKCKIELTIYGEKGWFTEFSYSRESHPDYIEWYPFIFVVKKETKPIFIGGLKKQNYSLNELDGTESMYLSDALDIFIDITRKDDITEHITDWSLDMIPLLFLKVLRRWTQIMNNHIVMDVTDTRYYLNDISIVYPGFNVSDFEEMWTEHGDFPDAERFVTCWITSTGEIKIVFWIKYQDNRIWFAQGYQCWIDPVSPFNIPREAKYIGNNREGYHAAGEFELLNLLVLNGVLPSAEVQNIPYIEHLDTIVSVDGTDIRVSGYFYPNPQRFNDNVRQSEILKCMLLVNMCTVSCIPKDYENFPYYELVISNRINPNTNIDSSDIQISRYFPADTITHISKRAILIDDSIFDAVSALLDAENKRIVLRQIYAKMLNNIVYTITFNVPSYLEGVSSLQLGDIIQTSGTQGNWIITGISDVDENGLLTFTCAGGY